MDGPAVAAPPAPTAAGVVFGERLARAQWYVGSLVDEGIVRGLLGPREVPRIWERHVLNCAVVASALAPGDRVVDVGSGAGLPGIPLALARPDVQVTLVEPLLRRWEYLREVVAALGLPGVEVMRVRAEDLHGQGRAWDVGVARAVAPLDRLAGWVLPLLVPGGRLLAWKGARASEELQTYLAGSGGDVQGASIRRFGEEILESPATVVELTLASRGRGDQHGAGKPAGDVSRETSARATGGRGRRERG